MGAVIDHDAEMQRATRGAKPNGERSREYSTCDAFLAENRKPLFTIALRATGNIDDAEELLQEALGRSFAHLSRLPAGSNFPGYVATTIHHLACTEFRKAERQKRKLGYVHLHAFGDDPLSEPDRALGVASFEDDLFGHVPTAVATAIRSLAPEFREVYLLAEAYDLPYKEIAQRMGTPIGTVMSRLNRAREKVQAAVGGAAAVDDAIEVGPGPRLASTVPVSPVRPHAGRPPAELVSAVMELPRELRRVFVAHHFQGQSYEQIARALKLPPATVQRHGCRADSRVQAELISASTPVPPVTPVATPTPVPAPVSAADVAGVTRQQGTLLRPVPRGRSVARSAVKAR